MTSFRKITTLSFVLATITGSVVLGAEPSESPLPEFPGSYGYVDGSDFHIERTIAPGITHRFDSYSTGPLTINTLFIATTRADIALEVEKGRDELYGSETLPQMVKRLADPAARPLAAINADFWGAKHIPIGPLVDEGMIWKAPWSEEGSREGRRRSFFGIDDAKNLFIGLGTWNLSLSSKTTKDTLPIPRVNIVSEPDDTVIYTYPGRVAFAPPTDHQKQVVLLSEGTEWLPNSPLTVTVESVGSHVDGVANASTFILHTTAPIDWITPGQKLTLAATLPELPGKVTGLVGGQPRLVENGKVIVDDALIYEATGKQFLTDMHPRSAIGVKKDGTTLVMVVVDGRQPRKSIGIDLYDLAKYMQSIGCDRAINLDGGGSTSMIAGTQIVNFPSDAGGPRSVSDAIVIRRTAPLGPPAQLQIVPAQITIPTGSQVTVQGIVSDAAGEYIPGADAQFTSDLKPSCDANIVTASGVNVTGVAAGDCTISQTLTNKTSGQIITSTIAVSVIDPKALSFSPPVLIVNKGDVEDVLLRAVPPDGKSYFQDYTIPTAEVPSFLQYDQKSRKLTALGNGNGVIRVKLGNAEARLPVAVGEYKQIELYAFDKLPAGDAQHFVQLTNANSQGTSITLDEQNKKAGSSAWRFQYSMAKGGTSKLALPLSIKIPDGVPELGVWVYGDGNEHWLRGELTDSRGETYLVDFTNTKGGIDWKDTWKFCTVSLSNPPVRGRTKSAAVPPFTLETIYIVQPQEAAKKDGTILLDQLSALDLPDALRAEAAKP